MVMVTPTSVTSINALSSYLWIIHGKLIILALMQLLGLFIVRNQLANLGTGVNAIAFSCLLTLAVIQTWGFLKKTTQSSNLSGGSSHSHSSHGYTPSASRESLAAPSYIAGVTQWLDSLRHSSFNFVLLLLAKIILLSVALCTLVHTILNSIVVLGAVRAQVLYLLRYGILPFLGITSSFHPSFVSSTIPTVLTAAGNSGLSLSNNLPSNSIQGSTSKSSLRRKDRYTKLVSILCLAIALLLAWYEVSGRGPADTDITRIVKTKSLHLKLAAKDKFRNIQQQSMQQLKKITVLSKRLGIGSHQQQGAGTSQRKLLAGDQPERYHRTLLQIVEDAGEHGGLGNLAVVGSASEIRSKNQDQDQAEEENPVADGIDNGANVIGLTRDTQSDTSKSEAKDLGIQREHSEKQEQPGKVVESRINTRASSNDLSVGNHYDVRDPVGKKEASEDLHEDVPALDQNIVAKSDENALIQNQEAQGQSSGSQGADPSMIAQPDSEILASKVNRRITSEHRDSNNADDSDDETGGPEQEERLFSVIAAVVSGILMQVFFFFSYATYVHEGDWSNQKSHASKDCIPSKLLTHNAAIVSAIWASTAYFLVLSIVRRDFGSQSTITAASIWYEVFRSIFLCHIIVPSTLCAVPCLILDDELRHRVFSLNSPQSRFLIWATGLIAFVPGFFVGFEDVDSTLILFIAVLCLLSELLITAYFKGKHQPSVLPTQVESKKPSPPIAAVSTGSSMRVEGGRSKTLGGRDNLHVRPGHTVSTSTTLNMESDSFGSLGALGAVASVEMNASASAASAVSGPALQSGGSPTDLGSSRSHSVLHAFQDLLGSQSSKSSKELYAMALDHDMIIWVLEYSYEYTVWFIDYCYRTREEQAAWELLNFLLVQALMVVVEAMYGTVTDSVGLLSASTDSVLCCIALTLGLFSISITTKACHGTRPAGWRRFESLSGFLNGILLVFVAFVVLFESIDDFLEPANIESGRVIIVCALGSFLNALGLWVFPNDSRKEDHNLQGAYLHIWANTLSSTGLLVSVLLSDSLGWTKAEPVIALLVSICILGMAVPLLIRSAQLLLLRIPDEMQVDICASVQRIEQMSGCVQVQVLHVHELSPNLVSVSARVVITNECDRSHFQSQVFGCLQNALMPNHITVQLTREDVWSRKHTSSSIMA